MSRKILKLLTAVLCAVLLIGAVPMNALAFSVDPKVQVQRAAGGTSSYSSLTAAVNAAADGDTVTLAGEVSNLTVTEGVSVTKSITFRTGEDFGGNKKYIEYNGTAKPLFTVEDGGVLTITDARIFGSSNASLLSGGCVLVRKGGTLVLDGKTDAGVIIKNFRLNAQGSGGGAVYAEQGATVILNGVTFENNFAGSGPDLYAEQKTDVTIKSGVTVRAAYGESVDINGLNLILTGEIGLVFHTVVPEKYLDGTFALTSRSGDPVTYKISECPKDRDGRYLAGYHLASIELSEPVTLTVYDKNGSPICSGTKSAEEYGNVLLSGDEATEKEKSVVKTLLNYGHFAQIECAANNGWELGRALAPTAKTAGLTADSNVFDGYAAVCSGGDPALTGMGVQLVLGYKTDIRLCFPLNNMPSVTVDGKTAEVKLLSDRDFPFCTEIKGISVPELDKVFTVTVNGNTTVTLSVLSYCREVMKSGSPETVDAVRALYEFYRAVLLYRT